MARDTRSNSERKDDKDFSRVRRNFTDAISQATANLEKLSKGADRFDKMSVLEEFNESIKDANTYIGIQTDLQKTTVQRMNAAKKAIDTLTGGLNGVNKEYAKNQLKLSAYSAELDKLTTQRESMDSADSSLVELDKHINALSSDIGILEENLQETEKSFQKTKFNKLKDGTNSVAVGFGKFKGILSKIIKFGGPLSIAVAGMEMVSRQNTLQMMSAQSGEVASKLALASSNFTEFNQSIQISKGLLNSGAKTNKSVMNSMTESVSTFSRLFSMKDGEFATSIIEMSDGLSSSNDNMATQVQRNIESMITLSRNTNLSADAVMRMKQSAAEFAKSSSQFFTPGQRNSITQGITEVLATAQTKGMTGEQVVAINTALRGFIDLIKEQKYGQATMVTGGSRTGQEMINKLRTGKELSKKDFFDLTNSMMNNVFSQMATGKGIEARQYLAKLFPDMNFQELAIAFREQGSLSQLKGKQADQVKAAVNEMLKSGAFVAERNATRAKEATFKAAYEKLAPVMQKGALAMNDGANKFSQSVSDFGNFVDTITMKSTTRSAKSAIGLTKVNIGNTQRTESTEAVGNFVVGNVERSLDYIASKLANIAGHTEETAKGVNKNNSGRLKFDIPSPNG